MVAHYGIIANLNAEKPRKLAQPVENPGLPVAKIPPRVRVAAAEERSSNAASDAVVNANTVFIDDVAAGVGWHGAAPSLIRCATLALCSYQQKWTKYHNALDCQASGGEILRPGYGARAEAKRRSEQTRSPKSGGRITWPRPREDETNGGCLPSS